VAGPDVAVIGGGIVGVAAASVLAAGGARVTLYERDGIAAGASGRNSGVVQHPLDAELATLHRDTLARYRDLAEASEGAFVLAPGPAGLLYVGRDPEVVRAQASAVAAAQPALRPELVEGTALRDLEPALAPGLVACRVAIGYPVAPAAATRAFAVRARALGVRIRTAASIDLAIDGDLVAGVRAGGTLEPTGIVLVAAGPWSAAIVDPSGAWRPIRPVWGVTVPVGLAAPPRHILEEAGIVTEPPDRRSASGERTATAHEPGVEFSLVTAGGSSIVGSTFLAEEPEPAGWAARILGHGAAFVPAIGGAAVLGYRSCARPLSADGRPLVGRVPWLRNGFIAAGHGPWGISTGPASAGQVADAILGRGQPIPAAFDPARFGESPGQRIV
jgi:glycine/D-amino acid oxidase-like deaminating enzyme